MKKPRPVALLAAGKLTGSPLARFRGLSERLGPVKSQSFRVASRIANRLRAGHPAKDYAEFEDCRLILLSVPDESAPHFVRELASARISWQGKAVVVCSGLLDSSVLCELSSRGAAIGSLAPISGFEDTMYVVEGDRLAIVEARRLVAHAGRRVVAIERSLKPLYLAATTCTGSLLFALLVAASESLRRAGVPSGTSAAILEKQLNKTLRSYIKSGRKAWAAPRDLEGQVGKLVETDPQLAYFLEQSALLAARLIEGR